jgi:hypothetical protein
VCIRLRASYNQVFRRAHNVTTHLQSKYINKDKIIALCVFGPIPLNKHLGERLVLPGAP